MLLVARQIKQMLKWLLHILNEHIDKEFQVVILNGLLAFI